jgi:glycosylphosphatidylinositol phospholipase D
VLALASLDGANGFAIQGIHRGDSSGSAVSDAGDINADGFDDIVIGAPSAGHGDRDGFGQSYVLFGGDTGFPAVVDLNELDGTNGFRLNGTDDRDLSGHSVSGVGDVNGDGVDDVAIGAPLADSGVAGSGSFRAKVAPYVILVGKVFVVFGHAGPFPKNIALSSLDGSDGFVAIGDYESYEAGWSVSPAGDVNDDGIDDFIIGAPRGSDPDGNFSVGWAYVVFGRNTGFPAELLLTSLDGTDGFAMKGVGEGSRTGVSVSGAGDVNGDGVDDVVIGAPYVRNLEGHAYVVFGRAPDTDGDGVRDRLETP